MVEVSFDGLVIVDELLVITLGLCACFGAYDGCGVAENFESFSL